MKRMLPIALVGFVFLTGCTFTVSSFPSSETNQTPTEPATVIPSSVETSTSISTSVPTQTSIPPTPTPESFTPIPSAPTATLTSPLPVVSDICTDPKVTALINSLKTSVQTSDGALLSSLVSPSRGMEVRYFRDGTVITYTQEQAKFLYETTFEANWGAAPGSGQDKIGSFHDVVVPELVKIFNQPYTLHCNELEHGGASYELKWPYKQGFYSVYFPGTEANGNLDWHTWVIGIDYENGKPYIYALMQFFWEP